MSKRVGLLFFTLVFAVLVACNESDDAGNFSSNENKNGMFSSRVIIDASSSSSDSELSSSSQKAEQKVKITLSKKKKLFI